MDWSIVSFSQGSFRVFDFANPDLHIAERHATTVPQQALFFLNDAFTAGCSKALAARSGIAAAGNDERVQRLYQSVLQRNATPREVSAALKFIAAAEADAPSPPKPVESAWRYGWGEYDATAHQVKSFNALPHFTGKAWQGGPNWPDKTLGWAQLTAEGGHAGNDPQHAVIRRWIAPRDATVAVAGSITHEATPGDGVHALIISSRHGELKSAIVHNTTAEMNLSAVEAKQGDALDFVVDLRNELNSDEFKWTPVNYRHFLRCRGQLRAINRFIMERQG
jgi:hypothetical protein